MNFGNRKRDEFIMYDDRELHIDKFIEWAKNQKCDVTICDVRRMIWTTNEVNV